MVIPPDGLIVFSLKLYGGSSSDKFQTKDCGILDYLQPGDSVRADRGSEIKDLLKPKRVGLNIPPFCTKDNQFTAEKFEETRRIASVRINVERAIQRIKTFHILDGVMPLSLHLISEDVSKCVLSSQTSRHLYCKSAEQL